MAHIHVTSWRQAYRGQISQSYLDSLDVVVRQKKWEDIFRATSAAPSALYLAHRYQTPIGFISFGPARDERFRGLSEIYALYVLEDAWNAGVGHALFKTAGQIMRERGFQKAYAWVLTSNERALRAYQRWGGTRHPTIENEDRIAGKVLTEAAITFDLMPVI